ncbi:DUF2599 domain-containing protein [Isoptericola halotolerans]|uniref:DUF2599 domain-containing protein n=1 Tax=Isoptericola halotolerans TaxID=300560 RepID=UPI00388D1B4C
MSSRRPSRDAPQPPIALLLALVGALAACTPDDGTSGAPVPPSASVSSAPATAPVPVPAPSVTPVEEVVRSGGVGLVVTSVGPAEVTADDDATRFTVGAGPRSPVSLAVDTGSLVVNADGTVTVHDDDGTPVAALTTPSGGARLTAADGGAVRLDADEPVTSTMILGSRAVEATSWGDREGGRSLAVTPTDWARTAGVAGEELVWTELVAADPDVGSTTMRDQLTCHVLGAPDKETWNLEPWRPDVGLMAVLAARCNPTDDGAA